MSGSTSRRLPLTLSAFVSLAIVACGGPITASLDPSPSPAPTPRPTPTAVPTPAITAMPSPTAVAGEPAELVVRVTSCSDICESTPGTTVLADGRIIWEGPDRRTFESRLTARGLERVLEETEDRDELATDGEYHAELRPGAQPFPRGTTVYRFEVGADDRRIVTSGEPRDFATEAELWIIPPGMERLARLARRLFDPLAWLGPDALAGPASPYGPDRYLVLVELYPGIGEIPDMDVDLGDVASPFGAPIDSIGEPLPQPDAAFPVRCLVTDADTARRLAAAETAAGARRDPGAWSSVLGYGWRRGQGFAQVTLTQVLPHQQDPCAELQRF